MHHSYRRLSWALILLLTTISAHDSPKNLTITSHEITEITSSTTPYLFTGAELSPLPDVINQISPLAQAQSNTEKQNLILDALNNLQTRLLKGQKTAPKELVTRAVEQIETLLNNHHELIPDDKTLRTVVSQLDYCKELINQDALLIERAPRPPLVPGEITGNVGSPNPAPESISNSSSSPSISPDITVIHNLYVGNDASISHNLSVGGNTIISGPLTVTEASVFIGGGLHVGGTSNPGTDNLLVDGTSSLTGLVLANGGIDVSPAGTLNIGPLNANVINIGKASSTTTFTETTDLAGKLITLNKGGAAATATSAGFQLEENSSITGYFKTSLDRNSWIIKPPRSTVGTITLTPGASPITIDQGLTIDDTPTFANVTLTNNGHFNFQETFPGTDQVVLQAPIALPTSYTLVLPPAQGTIGQILSTDGTGVLSFVSASSPAGGFINGGNMFGSTATLGTLDSKNLEFITENTSRITIANTAGFGVVTIIPNLTLVSNLNLAASSVINKNGSKFLHTSGGPSNVFLGTNSGSSITTDTHNTGVGNSTLFTLATGSDNVAVGYNALTASSSNALTAVGSGALSSCLSGQQETAVGFKALSKVTNGDNNTALGHHALANSTGLNNTAVGQGALAALTSGNGNTAFGAAAGSGLTSGDNNILIGQGAGIAYTTENNNVCIGLAGIAGDSVITRCANIAGTTISIPAKAVGINLNNQLGTEFIAPVNATALTIDGSATFNNPIRTQYEGTSYIYPTSLTGTTPNYYGFFYTNGGAAAFGPTDLDRMNFSFNFRANNPYGPPIINPAFGTAQITLGHNSITNGGNVVIGTNTANLAPVSRFEILETGTINLSSSNLITTANLPYIHADGTDNFYAGPQAGGINSATSSYNVGVGYLAMGLGNLYYANANVAVGAGAGLHLASTAGTENVCIGSSAGSSLATTVAYNIDIGSGTLGTDGDFSKIRLGNPSNNSCILFSGDTNTSINMAGSKWNTQSTTRISTVNIPIGGTGWTGTSDITGVSRVFGYSVGGWLITFVPLSTRAFVTAADIQPETGVWSEWTVIANVTNYSVEVYTFDKIGVLADRNVNVVIMGVN